MPDPLPFLSEVSTSDGVGAKPEMPSTAELIRVLEAVKLGYILPRFNGLDCMHDWASVLSLGEQQRLAFARLLLAKPTLALLDESTSALDETNEVMILILLLYSFYFNYGNARLRFTSTELQTCFCPVTEDEKGKGLVF